LPEQIKKLKHKTQDNIRKALLKSIDKGPDSFGKFIKKVDDNKALTETYDKLCSYLYHDMCLGCCVDEDRDKYLKSISNKAYKMMYRGKALNSGIENHFYKHIRLSVHQYDNSGPKFTFNLTGSIKAIAPWHSVPVRLLDGTFTLMTHFIAKDKVLAKVTYEKNNWLYLEVTDPKLTEFTYEVIKKPRFGLKVTANSYGYDSFSAEYLQKLSEDFGFVLLKNAPYEEQSELVNFTEKFGDIYQWDFGSVHVVKPEKEPKGFVHSIEKTPLHWDLSMLPLDHEMVANNEYFAATTFMLYCKTPPQKGEGQTTIVDSRIALKIAGQEKVALWKKTNVTYETKMTYFGGTPRIYPLVFKHPHNNDYILRYQEGSNLDLQKFELSSDQIPPTDFSEMVEDVNNIAYDERCLIAHVWEAGDLVIIDNNYTLHGRLSMTEKSMARELWRVQVF
jgi:alpha-ketoglutarate-dependent taurine dioxygenase